MRRVTNRDWIEETIRLSRPLTLAANLEGPEALFLGPCPRSIYVLVG
jgi:hypothetical protein